MTVTVIAKVSGTPSPSATIKATSGTVTSSTSASSGDGDALVTIPFAANELSAGDIIKVNYIYEAIHSSGDIIIRGWLGAIGSATRFFGSTISNGGTDQIMTADRQIFINTTTEAHHSKETQLNAVGSSGTAVDSIVIDTTTPIDLSLGYSMSAGTINLIGYTVEHIKAA